MASQPKKKIKKKNAMMYSSLTFAQLYFCKRTFSVVCNDQVTFSPHCFGILLLKKSKNQVKVL